MAYDKKGAELSLNFIIIAAIGLVVLVIALVFFTGGAEKLLKGVPETVQISQQQLNLWRTQCNTYCSLGNKASFCGTYNVVDKNKDGEVGVDDVFYVCDNIDEGKVAINKATKLEVINVNSLGVTCANKDVVCSVPNVGK